MDQIHNLMRRQIRKHFGNAFIVPEDFQSFFNAVNSAYWESDTDRGMLERALELSSQELLQTNSEMMALIKTFPDVLLWLNADGAVTGYKAGGATDLDIKIGEMVGRRVEDALGDAGIKLNEANKRVRSEGRPTSIEYSVVSGNNELFYEARLLPLFNDQVFAVIRDITQAKKMQEELRKHRVHLEEMVEERTRELKTANEKLQREVADRKQAEERFSKAFNANPNIMFILTFTYQQKDAVFIDVNKSFEQITGYKREEIIGRKILEFDIWEKPADSKRIVDMIRGNKEIRNLDLNCRIKSGEVRTCLISVEPIEFGGCASLLVSANDVTERKRIESEMARLERLNLVGEMAAGIGHELRNPMTAVKGFLQLLNAKQEYAKHKEFFDLMIDEMNRANSIITEFLSLAKNRMVELKTHNLNKIIKAISPLIDADGIVTDKQIVLELGDIPDMSLNEKEIRQLIFNLTRNGLEAMSPGGIMTIKTFREGGEVVLAVQDQGQGIEPDVLEKIGTPFFTTKDHGTGLGLAVCYSIADRHNAKIDVVSSPTGSVFYVRFKVFR
ncbi:ATP-binding protein [Pelotomaculum propionicicum]|uniref:ATP-binding protein n=1 Tax=Pelotomaculum propionicicum TaxID=258475 RepID=UPI003B7B386E